MQPKIGHRVELSRYVETRYNTNIIEAEGKPYELYLTYWVKQITKRETDGANRIEKLDLYASLSSKFSNEKKENYKFHRI